MQVSYDVVKILHVRAPVILVYGSADMRWNAPTLWSEIFLHAGTIHGRPTKVSDETQHQVTATNAHGSMTVKLSLHVLEIMQAILTAAGNDSVIQLKHQCERPAAMNAALPFGQLD